MKSFEYTVNTFTKNATGLEPVQLQGEISAKSKKDAIEKLINSGTIDKKGYEFLYLNVKKDDSILSIHVRIRLLIITIMLVAMLLYGAIIAVQTLVQLQL